MSHISSSLGAQPESARGEDLALSIKGNNLSSLRERYFAAIAEEKKNTPVDEISRPHGLEKVLERSTFIPTYDALVGSLLNLAAAREDIACEPVATLDY